MTIKLEIKLHRCKNMIRRITKSCYCKLEPKVMEKEKGAHQSCLHNHLSFLIISLVTKQCAEECAKEARSLIRKHSPSTILPDTKIKAFNQDKIK